MQTFMPEPSFKDSLAVLDDKRLGKQRVETKQILRAIRGETIGWRNHPATLMWVGYEGALARYGYVSCNIWSLRGFDDTLREYFLHVIRNADHTEMPPWFGYMPFHISHRSNLVRKDPQHYRRFYPDVPDDLPYFWPTKSPLFADVG